MHIHICIDKRRIQLHSDPGGWRNFWLPKGWQSTKRAALCVLCSSILHWANSMALGSIESWLSARRWCRCRGCCITFCHNGQQPTKTRHVEIAYLALRQSLGCQRSKFDCQWLMPCDPAKIQLPNVQSRQTLAQKERKIVLKESGVAKTWIIGCQELWICLRVTKESSGLEFSAFQSNYIDK